MKKSSALLLGAFLLFSIVLSIQVVSAETVWESILDRFSGRDFGFEGLDALGQGAGFAKFLLFILVALIVFAIADYLPFIGESDWIAAIISIIIAIFATLYLQAQEVYSILLSYTALGITITSIIPFLVMLALTRKVYEHEHYFFSKVLWALFAVVLILKLALAQADQIGGFGILVYLFTIVISVVMFFFEGNIHLMTTKMRVKAGGPARAQELIDEYTTKIQENDEDLATLAEKTDADSMRKKRNLRRDNRELQRQINRTRTLLPRA